jgi:hypothetical protein
MKLLVSCLMLNLFFLGTAFGLEFSAQFPAPLKTQLEDDLQFLGALSAETSDSKNPASPFHQEIFGDFTGETYRRWFENRVQKAGTDSCGGQSSVTACVFGIMPKWIYLSPNYLKFSMPQVVRASILIHEARHNEPENRNWPHEKCPIPFQDENGEDIKGLFSGIRLEGVAACDQTALGSYGTQLIFLATIANHCQSCTEKVRADARMMADDTFKRMLGSPLKSALKADLKW